MWGTMPLSHWPEKRASRLRLANGTSKWASPIAIKAVSQLHWCGYRPAEALTMPSAREFVPSTWPARAAVSASVAHPLPILPARFSPALGSPALAAVVLGPPALAAVVLGPPALGSPVPVLPVLIRQLCRPERRGSWPPTPPA